MARARPAKTKSAPAKKKPATPAKKKPAAKKAAPAKQKPPAKKKPARKRGPAVGVVGAAMVGDRLVIGMADAKRAPAARAALEASALEEGLRREGPGPWIRPDRFFALLAHADHAKPRDVVAAILDFARPALKHSKVPEELVAWSVTVGDWHVGYYYSLPDPHAWQEGEEQMVRFGDLPAYLHVAREQGDPAWDAVVVAEPGDDAELRVINQSHSDFDGETVWGLVERTTGLTLEALEQAIARGEPSWLVHTRTIVWREGR